LWVATIHEDFSDPGIFLAVLEKELCAGYPLLILKVQRQVFLLKVYDLFNVLMLSLITTYNSAIYPFSSCEAVS
jgi:hypothetical protein